MTVLTYAREEWDALSNEARRSLNGLPMKRRDGTILVVPRQGTLEAKTFQTDLKASDELTSAARRIFAGNIVESEPKQDPDLLASLEAFKAHPDWPRLSVIDQMQGSILVVRKFEEGPDWVPDQDTWRLFHPLKTDHDLQAEADRRDPTSPRWERVAGEAIDAVDLLQRTIRPLQQAVDGILPEGLGVLAAPPKAGKSMLAYQLAVELTLGHRVLGRTTEQRPVLYYALEDGERRSQSRVRAALGTRTLPRGLALRWDAPALGGGLEEEIAAYLDDHERGVVIIDVLAKVRPAGSKSSLNAYDADYQTLKAMHDVGTAHPGSVILFVTHDRKAGSDDFVTRVTGTRGVSGAADFIIFINRERGKTIGTIVTTGRDIEDVSIPVRFTGSGWEPADMTLQIGQASPTRQAIFDYVAKVGPVYQKAIAEGTGLDEDVVYHRVSDMAKDGQLVSVKAGYVVPGLDEGDHPL